MNPGPQDEFTLYRSNPAAWAASVAPRWIGMLTEADDERLLFMWRAARKELKSNVWALADNSLKSRLRSVTERTPIE